MQLNDKQELPYGGVGTMYFRHVRRELLSRNTGRKWRIRLLASWSSVFSY